MSKGKIPDRWIPYKPCGKVIEGTRIICFKVPLSKNVQVGVPGITQIWDIPAVLEEIPNLGAVIDLTNTARYYEPRNFQAVGVQHRKILMPGRVIPPESKVREFIDAVEEFLGKDCDSLIGVHCTHGLNRTGYMVCRYMRDCLNIPPNDAIKRFEEARGYQIERKIYIDGIIDTNKAGIVKEEDGAVVDKIVEVNPVKCDDEQYGYNNYKSNWRGRGKRNTIVRDGYSRNNQNVYQDRYNGHDSNGYDCNRRNDEYLSWRNRGEASSHSSWNSGGNTWRGKEGYQKLRMAPPSVERLEVAERTKRDKLKASGAVQAGSVKRKSGRRKRKGVDKTKV